MNSLKILQINISSIYNKKDIVETYLEQNNIQIAFLCETWLKDNTINFRNYNLLTKIGKMDMEE